MRGSLKTQITAALKCCCKFKESRHVAKRVHGGRSPYIHSIGTFDKTAKRLWPLADWLRQKGVTDIELLNDELVREYLGGRLSYHLERGNSRQAFKVEVSALGNLERGLTLFSLRHRSASVGYDFTEARKAFRHKAKELLLRTGGYENRALPDPQALLAALDNPGHKLMASLQLYCGCRCEGVGAPRRDFPGGNKVSMRNFVEGDQVLPPPVEDPVTGMLVRIFRTKEKGGKVAVKYCPLWLADMVLEWLRINPAGLGDSYETYLAAVNKAMRDTGQAECGRGTHALRFNFAQRRYMQCVAVGMGDEEAKRQVSHEMSHNRPDITEGYC